MPNLVAILEDDPDRQAAMRGVLGSILPGHALAFFDDAPGMIVWLADHLPEASLLSLDHDLPLWRSADGELVDAGCGREVADYLTGFPPTCPVIVHSSNAACAEGMVQVLREAGWPTTRVVPDGDAAEWVRDGWAAAIEELVRAGWIMPGGEHASG